jgi:hypothetical protein
VPVGRLIAEAFASAARKNSGVPEAWIRVSFKLGGLLPASRLSISVQQDGQLDVLLRTMEDEGFARQALQQDDASFESHYQIMLSEIWIGRFYEHLRLLNNRGLLEKTAQIAELTEDFRLLRVHIDKHEIASDRHLTVPLRMQKQPAVGNASDYTCTKGPIRSELTLCFAVSPAAVL